MSYVYSSWVLNSICISYLEIALGDQVAEEKKIMLCSMGTSVRPPKRKSSKIYGFGFDFSLFNLGDHQSQQTFTKILL